MTTETEQAGTGELHTGDVHSGEHHSGEHHSGDFKIFAILVIALLVSLLLGWLSTNPLSIVVIFAIATVKAFLVLDHFIHLEVEPHYIKVLVATILIVLLILFVGLVPDIVWVYGRPEAP